MTKTFDISIIVNAHREGLLLLPSLRSAATAIVEAKKFGLHCELILALDRPDELTVQMAENAKQLSEKSRVCVFDLGDLGESRNCAVQKASGEYIAFLDGDDLWCAGWLKDAFSMAALDDRLLILHPEFNLYFGINPHIYIHVDMEDKKFHFSALAFNNVWTSLCFAPRKLLLKCPYPKTDLSFHVGYEDWGWNMRAIVAGAIHKTVPGTFHAIRQKAVSLVKQTTAAGCFPAYPIGLFKKN